MLSKSFALMVLAALPFFVTSLPVDSPTAEPGVITPITGNEEPWRPDGPTVGSDTFKTLRGVQLAAGDDDEDDDDTYQPGPGGDWRNWRRDVEITAGDDDDEDTYQPGPGGDWRNWRRNVELTAGDEEDDGDDSWTPGPGGSHGDWKSRRDIELAAGDEEDQEDNSYVPGPGGSIPNYGGEKRRRGVENESTAWL